MLRLLADSESAAAMGRAGAERVRTSFRLETTVNRYYDLYAGAARDPRAKAA